MENKEINEPGHRLKKSAERGLDRMTTLIICFGFFLSGGCGWGREGTQLSRRINWDIENR